MLRLTDSHCHLDAAEFDSDRDAVVARARSVGVIDQVIPAVTAAGWPGLRALCAGHAGLHPAYGLHPMYLAEHRPEHLDALTEWLGGERAVAVGECGLDFHVEGLDGDEQRRYFLAQLRIARAFDLPVILHARRAVEEVTLSLRRIGGLRGVVHSFSGSTEQARQLWDMGFLIGIGGPVTYARARRLRALVASMPIEFLLLETDAPDQPGATRRGQRNEPAALPEILAAIAQLRDQSPEDVAAATRDNAARLFGIEEPVLFHNPRCSKSRAALELLHAHGVSPRIIDYLAQPPEVETLRSLHAALGVPARDMLRDDHPAFIERGLGRTDCDEERIFAAIAEFPALLQRPMFRVGDRAVIGRPPERVLDLIGTAAINSRD